MEGLNFFLFSEMLETMTGMAVNKTKSDIFYLTVNKGHLK